VRGLRQSSKKLANFIRKRIINWMIRIWRLERSHRSTKVTPQKGG